MTDAWRESADDRLDHVGNFHDNDAELIANAGRVTCVAIDHGSAVVFIAIERHIELLERYMTNRGVDLSSARGVGQVVCFDAPKALAEIVQNDAPDVVRFAEVLGAVVDRASARYPQVWIFSELVALKHFNGNHSGAVELERLLSSFVAARPNVFLYCAYPTNAFTSNLDQSAFVRICEQHCRILQSGGSLHDRSAREN